MSRALPRTTRPAAFARWTGTPALLAAALALTMGCADLTPPVAPRAPPAPSAPTTAAPPAATPTTPAPPFPALARGAEVYEAEPSLYGASAYHGGWLASRFVLFGDERFTLQFSSPAWGFFEYGGRYARVDSAIAFAFDGASIAGPWQATGTLGGDRLRVKFNDLMEHSDFVSGVYVRASTTP